MFANLRRSERTAPRDTGLTVALLSQEKSTLIAMFGIINGTGLPMFDAETKPKRELVDTLMRKHDSGTLQEALFAALTPVTH
jgi:hypothetical protein